MTRRLLVVLGLAAAVWFIGGFFGAFCASCLTLSAMLSCWYTRLRA